MTVEHPEGNPNIVKIHTEAAASNLRSLSMRLDAGVQIMPVVKSDAYGHGIVEISRRLVQENCVWGLGIATVQDAICLRNAGITHRLFLLAGCFPGDEVAVAELGVVVGAISIEMIDRLQSAAHRMNTRIPVHIKVDTGMGRYGLYPDQVTEMVSDLGRWPDLLFQGIYTHMPVADDRDNEFNHHQIRLFSSLIRQIRKLGWRPEYVHMANSAAIFNFPDSHFNLVRPGIAIYGSLPEAQGPVGLRPVMTFSSSIASIKQMQAGSAIGYGHAARIEKNSVVAVVPTGYDDGYMRSLSCRGFVLVKGTRCNILGRICMKAFMVDVSNVPEPAVGDRVVLIGSSDSQTITVDDLASWANTISYELLCLIGTRNPRITV